MSYWVNSPQDRGDDSGSLAALGDSQIMAKARDYGRRFRRGDRRAAIQLSRLFAAARSLGLLAEAESHAGVTVRDLP